MSRRRCGRRADLPRSRSSAPIAGQRRIANRALVVNRHRRQPRSFRGPSFIRAVREKPPVRLQDSILSRGVTRDAKTRYFRAGIAAARLRLRAEIGLGASSSATVRPMRPPITRHSATPANVATGSLSGSVSVGIAVGRPAWPGAARLSGAIAQRWKLTRRLMCSGATQWVTWRERTSRIANVSCWQVTPHER